VIAYRSFPRCWTSWRNSTSASSRREIRGSGFQTALTEAEGLLVSSKVVVDRQVMERAPRLRVISTMSVGWITSISARPRASILVTITPVLMTPWRISLWPS